MKRTIGAIGAVAALLALFTVTFVALQASAAPKHRPPMKHRGGEIRIERWLHASPNSSVTAGTTFACFKISGAVADQGGGPTWSDQATFEDNSKATTQCAKEEPIGGFTIVPPPAGAAYSGVVATHTMSSAKGQFVITMAGDYNLGPAVEGGLGAMQGSGTWVITGGAGIYRGMQGSGTWTADLRAFASVPYCRHVEVGQVWWTK